MSGTESATGRTAVFERYRGLLFGVSYDMLGSVADAEDCVQEAWIRWAGDDRSDVRDPRGYLIRTVTNVTLNRLRAARARRESYVGPWLPEPLVTGPDVAEEVERAESVSMAMLVVLETLNPVERAVFVLREVFGLPHAEIAEALDRSEASVRQLAHRAREHVHARRPRFTADSGVRRRLTERFLAACVEGDVAGLKDLLADDVVVLTDGGGKVRSALNPLYGPDKSARFLVGVARGYRKARLDFVDVNGAPGIVLYRDGGDPTTVGLLEADGDRITRIYLVRNPDKLRRLGRAAPGSGPVGSAGS
ncbi:RNA polymerase sigma-70 factor (ECF subfamily) [Spinactinospora alkalitolerans]|uniref:RNA polymerase sigma-70 factor (ECF subfamily) n=1 Tax=Spinactinospora alkalitolerans TaxID=687207 RepID=A0A852TS87_9ACTN|nr:RNA polymerase sigma-70 factor [Spinactinospora alkalitolerans]NYE45722.1 RNA polymerase sigma-70 factor (ECF subfamily) [Spinactinospora alkalitolerans]